MELGTALIVWILVVIIVLIIARLASIRWWSAIVLALVIGLIVLLIIYPPTGLNYLDGSGSTVIYSLIVLITPIVALVYILQKALTDRAINLNAVPVPGAYVTPGTTYMPNAYTPGNIYGPGTTTLSGPVTTSSVMAAPILVS